VPWITRKFYSLKGDEICETGGLVCQHVYLGCGYSSFVYDSTGSLYQPAHNFRRGCCFPLDFVGFTDQETEMNRFKPLLPLPLIIHHAGGKDEK
jgi:hypothetical protein